MTGALTIHSRQHFHKRYDLLERAMPDALGVEPVSSEEFRRWHLERSLRAMGAATELDLARYLTFPRFAPGARRAALRGMLERGEIVEVEVEGRAGPLARARARSAGAGARASGAPAPRAGRRCSRHSIRCSGIATGSARLFGFDYRIEVYTPGHKRVHGYYTLPILHDGHLIGRVDAKAHRAERRLEVRHVHFEPGSPAAGPPAAGWGRVDRGRSARRPRRALGSLATFVGGDRVDARPRDAGATEAAARAEAPRCYHPDNQASRGAAMNKEGSQLIRGLEGVVAAETKLCDLDGAQRSPGLPRLRHRRPGAAARFEEVCHLLWHGELPKPAQLDKTTLALHRGREIPADLVQAFRSCRRPPTHARAAGRGGDPRHERSRHHRQLPRRELRKAVRLTSQMATAICAHHRVRRAARSRSAAASDLSHAANFLYMLTGERPSPAAVPRRSTRASRSTPSTS